MRPARNNDSSFESNRERRQARRNRIRGLSIAETLGSRTTSVIDLEDIDDNPSVGKTNE